MKTSQVLVAAAALGAAIVTAAAAATSAPHLRSASSIRRHVVVVYTLGPDTLPGRLVVATRAQTEASGKFVQSNIRFSEALVGTRVAGGAYRMRSRHTLAKGRYYVEVAGTAIGLDCTPKTPCPLHWSNVRRVVVK
ncbi:MAG TPA: hypothetical protein VIW19_00985 [Gaiellaceae bacterium]|jgi:hypothetical protein